MIQDKMLNFFMWYIATTKDILYWQFSMLSVYKFCMVPTQESYNFCDAKAIRYGLLRCQSKEKVNLPMKEHQYHESSEVRKV